MRDYLLAIAFSIACVIGYWHASEIQIPTRKSVYSDNVVQLRNGVYSGTGTFIDERHVITACHVGRKANASSVYNMRAHTFDGSMNWKLRLVMCDRQFDLALYEAYWPNHDAIPLDLAQHVRTLDRLNSAGFGAGVYTFKEGRMGVAQLSGNDDMSQLFNMPAIRGDSGSMVFNEDMEMITIVTGTHQHEIETVRQYHVIDVGHYGFGPQPWMYEVFLNEHYNTGEE